MHRRCMVLQRINSFSAAQKNRAPGTILKQVTFNAKAWRTSHPVRRDDPSAPDLLHWAFPRVPITRHNLEIMWEYTLVCPAACVTGCLQGPVRCLPLLLALGHSQVLGCYSKVCSLVEAEWRIWSCQSESNGAQTL